MNLIKEGQTVVCIKVCETCEHCVSKPDGKHYCMVRQEKQDLEILPETYCFYYHPVYTDFVSSVFDWS